MNSEIKKLLDGLRSDCNEHLRRTVEGRTKMERDMEEMLVVEAEDKKKLRDVCIRIASSAQAEKSALEEKAYFENRLLEIALLVADYRRLIRAETDHEERLRRQQLEIDATERTAESMDPEDQAETVRLLAEDEK